MLSSRADIVTGLIEDIITAIADGRRNIVIWGATHEALYVLSELRQRGFSSYISAIIDQRESLHGQLVLEWEVQSPQHLSQLSIDTLVIAENKDKEKILEEFARIDRRTPLVVFRGNANYEFDDPFFYEIVSSCIVKPKAGGYPHLLIHLYQALKHVTHKGLQGDICEFGVFQGGTTVFMAKVLGHFNYPGKIYGFDTFAGFPAPKNVMDMYNDKKCEYLDFDAVKRYCSPYNIELVSGDICETYKSLQGIPLVLSFFDTDNYSPTRAALDMCIEQTVLGGVLVFDHYFSPTWERTLGERIAIQQTLSGKDLFNLHGTGIFLKI